MYGSLINAFLSLGLLAIILLFFKQHLQSQKEQQQQQQALKQELIVILERLSQLQTQRHDLHKLLKEQQNDAQHQRARFDEHQIKTLKLIQDSLSHGLKDARDHINTTLNEHGKQLTKHINALTEETKQRLKDISREVDRQLNAGFEKTTATFSDVMKRLTIIDQAQKKITELSSNVVSLQEILSDKRSRGAFGEVQLNSLIRNIIPETHFSLQHTLSNGKRADCLLLLPEPTGHVVIDAKFPLESYRQITNDLNSNHDKQKAEQQFKIDIKKHIQDIAQKYILPGETADGAMMFIPAEAIFAEIHAHFPALVEQSQKMKVWLVSPTTMMAILTTARAVLKDDATRKQVHIIQKHLIALNKDFGRFQTRMDHLARHVNQAHHDVEQVHKSSQKISSHFNKIEQVELTSAEDTKVLLNDDPQHD